jgi:hypothetical protein
MNDKEATKLGELCDEVLLKLGEHFDSLQIMATTTEAEGTRTWFRGTGNWFARQGLAHEFIGREQAELTGKSVATELRNE